MDPTLFWYVVATVLVLVGLAGVILPALPGLPLVFVGMLVAAWAGDFQRIGPVPLIAPVKRIAPPVLKSETSGPALPSVIVAPKLRPIAPPLPATPASPT